MLILTRKVGEKLIATIPPSDEPREIEITLLDVRSGGRASIGIDAEREIGIHRATPDGVVEGLPADAFADAQ